MQKVLTRFEKFSLDKFQIMKTKIKCMTILTINHLLIFTINFYVKHYKNSHKSDNNVLTTLQKTIPSDSFRFVFLLKHHIPNKARHIYYMIFTATLIIVTNFLSTTSDFNTIVWYISFNSTEFKNICAIYKDFKHDNLIPHFYSAYPLRFVRINPGHK